MDPTGRKLSLHAFLKIFTANDIAASKAMTLANKAYKEFNTPARLSQLDDTRLIVLGVEDRELRKSILAAIRKAGYTKSGTRTQSPAVQDTATSPRKKRRYDSDLIEPLQESPFDEASTYGNLEFGEILDEEILRSKTVVVNRAPVMTAWAMTVAERLGFDREESLSIASVYTEANAVSKGASLGVIEETRKKATETLPEGEQPYVDLMGRRQVYLLFYDQGPLTEPCGICPLYQTRTSKWLALSGGSPALPSTAFSYISRSFRQATPYVMGSLRLLAESYSPQKLNELGYSLYADFRPAVDGWGKRGELRCIWLLSLRESGAPELDSETSGVASGPSNKLQVSTTQPQQTHTCPAKKDNLLSLEEYEATVDAGFDGIDLSHLP
ncbi:hypothetical protein M404DRAFT_993709 [Pisolithus tinctorius Marx 270]|uniref:Uncharacterized protein n=1 Tax=Pisolithus tinctorius Marx 270 TaxID=870435 RepID=A0A0C3JU99_PISTI|nr:hypothetical protein M404DRAFT_993709 [Pisolithus tinctorius Marx 270]